MEYQKFSHKTPHLKGKQHQLDPNLDTKQLVKHATIQYVDWDNDGDVDEYDKKPKLVPDENPTGTFAKDSKKLIAKQKGEIKHTKRGMAYEQMEEKRYCPLCDKKETRSECSYGPKMWDKYSIAKIHPANEAKDHEHSMARSELATIEKAVKRLKSKMKGEGNIEAWVQSKITKAADYIDSAADYLDSGEHDVGESVSFSIGSGHRTAQRKEKSSKISSQGSTEGERTAGKKAVQRMGGTAAELPTIKKEEKIVDKILQEIEEEKKGLWANIHARREKGLPKKKPGQKGYPKTLDIEEGLKQARKNVGASKCWTGKKVDPNQPTKIKNGKEVPNCVPESITIEDANGNTFAEISDVISIPRNTNEDEVCAYCGCDPCECEGNGLDEAVRIPAKSGNLLMVVVMWRGKTYGLRVFFPQSKMPNKKEVEQEIQKIYPESRVTYFQKVEREPGQPFLQVEGAAWTKKSGKSEGGGLNEKGRRSYERENPGSDLKAPSKKVGNPRRKSFCARMKGMKSKLTSSKTANDPDSRINKSLRAWNC